MDEKETKTKGRPVKKQSKIKTHFMRGITMFLVILTCIACYFAFLRFNEIASLLGVIGTILQPIFFGIAFAYLLNPIVKKVEENVQPLLKKKMKNEKRIQGFSRGIGITAALLLTGALIVLLLNMIIPELYRSIRDLILSLPSQMNDMIAYLQTQKVDDSVISDTLGALIESGADSVQTWLRQDLLNQVNLMMSSVTEGIFTIVGTLVNILIGVIVSVYVLSSKEIFIGQCKKITYAVMSPEHANLMLHITRKSNDIFGGFVIGKIIDSIIIGILCFVGLSILNMPYIVLVSVIVGVTNVIPFFGPYIGAIPCSILILLNNPVKGIYFILFIIVLQQFDGNILGPKILGNSTGLSAFWVVFSILLGGGLFGFIGMIMGVPTFAVIYYLVDMFLNQKLSGKELPTTSDAYQDIDYINDHEKTIYYMSGDKEKIE